MIGEEKGTSSALKLGIETLECAMLAEKSKDSVPLENKV